MTSKQCTNLNTQKKNALNVGREASVVHNTIVSAKQYVLIGCLLRLQVVNENIYNLQRVQRVF